MTVELTEVETAALGAVDEAASVRLLAELVAIPSITGTAAESEAQHWVARQCEQLGLDVDLWPLDLDALTSADGFPGMEAPRESGLGLVAVTPEPVDGPTLVLQGHVDVVPPGDLAQWVGTDPFAPRVVDGVLFGRGTCDMKAGVVANLLALDAVRRSGARLRGTVAIHSVGGEEDGGLGAFATLRRGYSGDACVITEPTSGTVITANGGALTFTLRVPGLATHAATRYAGVSAFEKFLLVNDALVALERERNADVDPLMAEYPIAYPLSVGRVVAGDWSSSVPDLLVAEGRFGVQLDEDVASARSALEHRVAEVNGADPWLREHPVSVEWSGGQFASGRFPEGNPFLDLVRGAHADATGGGRPRERGAPYGSDLRLYNAGGIPSLHLGPGEVRYAHGPLEQVRLSEVAAVARSLVLTILRTCGTR